MNYRQIAQQTKASLGTISAEIEKARKAEPDLDSLRELNVNLKKSGIALLDAMSAASLLVKMNELGLTLDQISSLVTGEKANEVARLEGEKTRLEEELKSMETKCSLVENDLKGMLSTRQILLDVGLDKVADLARFVNEFETLGFGAAEVRELAQLKKELDEGGIRLGTLRQHFKSTRVLKQRREALQKEIESWEAKLKVFSKMGREMERKIQDMQRIQYLMNMRKAFTCGYCGSQFFHELTRIQISQCLARGQPIILKCQRCGAPNTYNTYEVLARLGFEVLS